VPRARCRRRAPAPGSSPMKLEAASPVNLS
jgi:hypothetical protein